MAMLFENEVEPTIGAIAPWFGSNRMLAPVVGQEIGRVDWCGVPFAGSMSEVRCIKARSILHFRTRTIFISGAVMEIVFATIVVLVMLWLIGRRED